MTLFEVEIMDFSESFKLKWKLNKYIFKVKQFLFNLKCQFLNFQK